MVAIRAFITNLLKKNSVVILIIIGLSLVGLFNTLLFHDLIETFSVFVTLGTFFVVWNSRRFYNNNYLLFIGIAFAFVGGFNLLHIICDGAEYSRIQNIEFALIADLILATTLLVAPSFFHKKLKPTYVFSGFFVFSAIVLLIVFIPNSILNQYAQKVGPTKSFTLIHYLMILFLCGAIIRLLQFRKEFKSNVLRILIVAVSVAIIEAGSYIIRSQFFIQIHNYLEFITAYLLYMAILKINLMEPYYSLARNQVELADSKLLFKAVFEEAAIGIGLLDIHQNRYIEVNSVVEQILGYQKSEIINKGLGSFTYPDDRESDIKLNEEMLAGVRDSYQIEKRYLPKDGRIIWGRLTSALVRDSEGQPRYAIRTIEDITPQKQLQKELTNERERLAVTLGSISEGVVVTDEEGKIVLFNKAAEKITGWDQYEVLGRRIPEVIYLSERHNSEIRQGWARHVLTENVRFETAIVDYYSKEHLVELSASPLIDPLGKNCGMVLVILDIAKRRKAEAEELRMAKLESIGVLAGGIAHDFNNILAAILANSQLTKMMVTAGKDVTKNFDDLEKAVQRATALTNQLLTFAKGGAPVKQAAALPEVVTETVDFALKGSSIKCQYAINEDLWPAHVDVGQISQVINNLVINAKQAMCEGGTIQISIENAIIDSNEGLPLTDGKYIKLIIKDEGTGIPESILPRVFDPYFTTKNKGSGLGLATAYAIIKHHDGFIKINSKIGRGTSVAVYLPAAMNGQKVDAAESRPELTLVTSQRKVLLMDDDVTIRELISKLLTEVGYRVELARNGTEAIEIYCTAKASADPVAAVILDLTIPGGMGGKETMGRLLEFDPKIIAIVSSGYFNDPVMADYRRFGFRGVLKKPFDFKDLVNLLTNLISAQ